MHESAVFGVQGGSMGDGGSRSVHWADQEPSGQSGFRIGGSQQVCMVKSSAHDWQHALAYPSTPTSIVCRFAGSF